MTIYSLWRRGLARHGLATAYDLAVFFRVVSKLPVQVTSAGFLRPR